MNADWPSRAIERRDETVVAIFGMRGLDVLAEPGEGFDRAAVDQRRIVDLEPGRQPVDDEQPGVARLRLGHFQRHHDALVLRHALQRVELGSVELVEGSLDRIAVGDGRVRLDRRAGNRDDELRRHSVRHWR